MPKTLKKLCINGYFIALSLLTDFPAFSQSSMYNNALPDKSFTTLSGEKLNLKDLKGNVVVLCFWFIGCKPCIEELPLLNKLVEAYQGKKVQFLAPALDGTAALQSFMQKNKFNYTILANADEDFVTSYTGQLAFPMHVVIDSKGNVKGKKLGGLREKDLESLMTTITQAL